MDRQEGSWHQAGSKRPLLDMILWKGGRVRLIAFVLKTKGAKASVGSNPTPSSILHENNKL